jgi:hypothetical protein
LNDAGSFGHSNSSEIALAKTRELWSARNVDIMLFVGTVSQKVVNAGRLNELAQINQRLLNSCEAVHDGKFRTPIRSRIFV